jgi:hypothetical protein
MSLVLINPEYNLSQSVSIENAWIPDNCRIEYYFSKKSALNFGMFFPSHDQCGWYDSSPAVRAP